MQSLQELEHNCQSCTRCGLCETRNNMVFGVGNPNADVMFIGEGPGEQEDLKGEPFVGPAGKLLDAYLSVIDLDRTKCYIANIVKCRPPMNRDPLPEEQEACLDHLRQQFRLIRPKIVVCLGRIAAQKIMDPEFRVTRQHGQFVNKKGTPRSISLRKIRFFPFIYPLASFKILVIHKVLLQIFNFPNEQMNWYKTACT